MSQDTTPVPAPLVRIFERAKGQEKTIALSEGEDPRVVKAACNAVEQGIAQIILVGDTAKVTTVFDDLDLTIPAGIRIEDPSSSPLSKTLRDALVDKRKHKGMTEKMAAKAALDPLLFAALLVETGIADGTVGGAVATTSDTVRAALQIIGKAPNANLVSSFFLMCLPKNNPLGMDAVVFSDCGMVIDPDATQLAHIASDAANSFACLTNDTARVAMLSFSTRGSAHHPAVDKVSQATELARSLRPELAISGDIQLDAAIVPDVAHAKAPNSQTAGRANVLIFPNLDAGNIGYKLAQRFGNATAIGPVLQGLAKPANDLSRGCTASDVLAMIAVTAVQAS